jgi:hypothetical protein
MLRILPFFNRVVFLTNPLKNREPPLRIQSCVRAAGVLRVMGGILSAASSQKSFSVQWTACYRYTMSRDTIGQ